MVRTSQPVGGYRGIRHDTVVQTGARPIHTDRAAFMSLQKGGILRNPPKPAMKKLAPPRDLRILRDFAIEQASL